MPGVNLPALVSWRQRRQVASCVLPARVGWTGVDLGADLGAGLGAGLGTDLGADLGADIHSAFQKEASPWCLLLLGEASATHAPRFRALSLTLGEGWFLNFSFLSLVVRV